MRTLSDTDADGYSRPIQINDWGNLGYFTKIVESDSGTRGNNEQDPATQLSAGEKVHVKWPDGMITIEKIVSRPYSEHIQDMGSSYTQNSESLHIEIDHRGTKLITPLEQLRVKKIAKGRAKR